MRKEFLKNILLCVIVAALFFFMLFSFREDKKASIQFTKDQYVGIQSRLIDAIKTVDSLKVILHYSGADSRVDASAQRAQREIGEVSNFIAQVDSVFAEKPK